MLGWRNAGQRVGYHGDGPYAGSKRRAMRCNVDPESQAAYDREFRNPLC